MNKGITMPISRSINVALLGSLALLAACNKSDTRSTQTSAASATAPAESQGIEVQIVQAAPMAGAITATGTVLVPENHIAAIGPVHEGRIVHLYAGQGAHVRKGQKLADLESADIDEAKSDYLKASADYENARKTTAAELRLAQSTYDRTKLLFEKSIARA